MLFVILWAGLIVAWPVQGQEPTNFQATEKYWFDLKFQVNKKFSDFFNWRVSEAPLIRGVGGLHYNQFSNQTRINQLTFAKAKKSDQAPSLQNSLIKGAGGSAPTTTGQRVPNSSLEEGIKRQQKTQVNQEEGGGNQTAGIMLEYRQLPPSGKEQADILQTARENDLVKTHSLPISRLWGFSWRGNEKKDALFALFTCAIFYKFPSIKSCWPDYVFYPATELFQYQESPVLPAEAPKLDQINSLQKCDIIQTHQPQPDSKANKLAGRYWAQNMIGADLLRAEIQKKNYHPCRTILSLFLTAVVTMNKL